MLTVRDEQMNEFSQTAYRDFENRMVAHLLECFADECKALGERSVRDEIRYGTRRAGFHGFEAEYDVCLYLDLMFTFGSDFDGDPALVTVQEILYDNSTAEPSERMSRLHETAITHLERA